ncbi:MAG: hypothetical protein QM667_11080 [Asticcacaulis sp.]
MDIEGVPLKALKALSKAEQDALLAFGRPLTFRIGSANILAEFNRSDCELIVNLAHIDGGGEGVLVLLWKALQNYAADRGYLSVQWHVHALTCTHPNPRLQQFLRHQGFVEMDHQIYGQVFAFRQVLVGTRPSCVPDLEA